MLRPLAVALASSALAVACVTTPARRDVAPTSATGSNATETTADEFDHSSYVQAELADVAAGMEIDPRVNYWLDASHAKYKATVTYTGEMRPIDPNVKRLITMWATALQHPDSVPAVFNNEVQVFQAGKTYWMPIQDVLVAPWREEMGPGTEAGVYLLLMGAYERAPVFTVASFMAKIQQSSTPPPLRGAARFNRWTSIR